MANIDYKNGKLIEIIREFDNTDSRYEINGITQAIAVPFWRKGTEKFQVIPKGAYRYIQESGNNYLEILDNTILEQAIQFQICYVYSQISSKYIEDFPELTVLVNKYNELIDDTTKLFSYLKSVGMTSDTLQLTKVMSQLEPLTTWYMDESGEIKALPISDLYGKFNQMIEHLKNKIEELLNANLNDTLLKLIEKLKEETDRLLDLLASSGNNLKPKQVPDIEFLKRVNAKVDEVYEVLGYYKFDDGATHKRVISRNDDGSGILLKNGLYANILHNGEVNVSWFGAKGDGKSDDTKFIQQAINYKTHLFAQGEFLISNTIEINDRYHLNINFENTFFKNIGSGYAFKLYKITYCVFRFGRIFAENGNGIELYSDGGIDGIYNYTQYLDIYFKETKVKGTCFYFNSNGSWITEVRIHSGQVFGNVGFYADSKNKDAINGIKLHDIGFEGINTGVWLKNNCLNWSIVTPRFAEAIEPLLIKTEGIIRGLLFIGQDHFYHRYVSFSNKTFGKIISQMTNYGGSVTAYEAIINEGIILVNNSKDGYLNLYNKVFEDLSDEKYYDTEPIRFFLVGDEGNVKNITLKLSDKFGKEYGANYFYLRIEFYNRESSFKILDYQDNIIFHINNFEKNSFFKLSWHRGVNYYGKWYCEKIEIIDSINTKNLNTEQLNTIYMGEKMRQENVYDDYISYMDEQIIYNKQQREIEKQLRISYEKALKKNPNLLYEEWVKEQPVYLPLEEEPQPSEALKKFMEKYL